MKFFTIALVFALTISYGMSLTPVCTSTNYCQGCSDTTLGRCTGCFSWGSGSVLARILSSTAYTCLVKRVTSLVTNCQFYSNASTSDVLAYNTCAMCKSGYVQQRAYTAAVKNNYVTSNWSATTCTKKSSTYTEISNCRDGMTAWITGTGITSSSFCLMCKSSYKNGATLDANYGGFTTCTSGAAITNCEYSTTYNSVSYSSSTTNASPSCYSCKSKYAVASTSLTCTSFTTDSNCRQLTSAGVCGVCWYSYYFNSSKCKLASSLMSFAAIALAALVALF